uniref:Ribonuclease H-like domain-containing protein n=1 Tax=Tanacetum cinerariifolium TaxID=118510 RepID=A0A699IBZ7_TANCI|nr:ribonuclease H-like domain-containing protein [Tanacetum cinerariifolium]
MRLEECDTWDGGKIAWGGLVGALGTVHVYVCVHRKGWGRGTSIGGKSSLVTVWVVVVLGGWQFRSSGFVKVCKLFRRHITRSQSPKTNNSPPRVTTVQASVVSAAQEELKFNLFSVSQMCDKKNSVLFTDTECLVLSPDFKLPDESQVLLRVPKENNMYNVNLKNIVLSEDLTCLFAKATIDESNLWHRRLAHINFKTINKLVKCNLVRGLPTKVFENDNTCVACKKGKQHCNAPLRKEDVMS